MHRLALRVIFISSVACLAAFIVVGLVSAAPTKSGRDTAASRSAKANANSSAVNNEYLPAGTAPCGSNWLMFGCDTTTDGYSQLSQITESNVTKLHVVWNEGFDPSAYQQAVESQPICCANGMMYSTTGAGFVALNPTNGKIIWQYQGPLSRGVINGVTTGNFGARSARSEAYDPKTNMVYGGQQDGSIIALNAKTGAPVWTDQVEAVGTYGTSTSLESEPFTVYCGYAACGPDGLIFSGPNNGDTTIRGHIDAYDAKTGALVWRTWFTPDPTQLPAILSWSNPAEAATGGGADWSLPSEDPATGLIYLGTGNVYPYTGRQPGNDLWTSTIVALQMGSGQIQWAFQAIRHDEWDYDCPNTPVEYNAMVGGKLTPVVSSACKSSYVYLLNPTNGRPIYPIKNVQMSTLPGYTAAGLALNNGSPTQPEPTGGEAGMIVHCPTAAMANVSLPGDYPNGPNGQPVVNSCDYVNENGNNWILKPYYTSNGIDYPRASFDPKLDYQFFCATTSIMISENASPSSYKLTIINSGRVTTAPNGESGTVTALNVSNNTVAWQRQLIASQDGNCYSGTLTTSTGLLFYATKGRTDGTNTVFRSQGINPGGILYAVDAKTGNILWKFQNPYGDLIEAPPITYMYGGKQYIAEYFECPTTQDSAQFTGCSSHDQLMVFST